MGAREEFRAALVDGDVRKVRRIARHLEPHLPEPSRDEAEQMMHRARTEAESIPLKQRAWSHRWLCERGLPSGLPMNLRPKAEQMFPRVQLGVGLAVKASKPELRGAAILIRGAMEDVVRDADASGRLGDAAFVKARIEEARTKEQRALFGRFEPKGD
jgi:hypothetical protein